MMCESTNVDKLCRLCGSESGIQINIFEPDSEHVKKIHKLLPITVNEHDPLPKYMCYRCTFKVNEFYDFRTICVQTQEDLKKRIPWLQNNASEPEEVFVEEPMVQLNVNPLNISLVDSKENMKKDPLAIEDNCQEGEQALEPEIVTYSMPAYIGGGNTNRNNNVNGNERKQILKRRKKGRKRPVVKRKPIKDTLTKIWKTTKRKRRVKTIKSIRRMGSETETEFVFTQSDTPPEISRVLINQNNISNTYPDEHGANTYATEDRPRSDEFCGIVETGENKLPANILVTNIPRVGFVYTCENCARTFLASDSASRHICDTVDVEMRKMCDWTVGWTTNAKKNGTYTWSDERKKKQSEKMKAIWAQRKRDNRQIETSNMEISDVAEYVCEICGKVCRSVEHLQTHTQKHSESSEFHCEICDRKFRREGPFNVHLQQHFNNCDSPPANRESEESLSSWYSD